MYKCLVSGGCSFAYGFNLKERDKRYANLIAQHLDVELIDVSAAGMTNEFISAAAVFGINKALQKYSSEEILVIVGWTTTERFEYFNNHVGRIVAGYVNAKHHAYGDKRKGDMERAQFISQHFWSPAYGYYKLIHSFNYVHSFCRAHNVTVIHKHNVQHYPARFPSMKLLHTKVSNSDLLDQCLTLDAKNHFKRMSDERSFQEFTMKENLILNPGVDTHPNEKGNIL